eukprot:CAMPEP_0194449070 /NCGR_PEP_ID=MMETSP0176-20130528/129930_1 /TAXON_ID=216777 /ORGANISM="Proboscia alata, Strain PI-D3" /LENGTH=39 /DNA_ID= /DNA_START= /DNA_END= /DNA_ORIENTATION=
MGRRGELGEGVELSFTTARLPWVQNSTTSSPMKLPGEGK